MLPARIVIIHSPLRISQIVVQLEIFLSMTQLLVEILSAMIGSNWGSFGHQRGWIVCGHPSSYLWRVGTPDQCTSSVIDVGFHSWLIPEPDLLIYVYTSIFFILLLFLHIVRNPAPSPWRMKIVRVAWGNVLPSPPVIATVQEKGKMTLASDDGHIFGQRTLAAVITVIVPPPQTLKTKIPRRMMVAMMIELGRTRTLAQDIHHPHMKLVRTHLMRTIHVHMSEYKSTYYMQVTTSRQASTAFLAKKKHVIFKTDKSKTRHWLF